VTQNDTPDPAQRELQNAARAHALESLLTEKGIITERTVDTVLEVFEQEMTPSNGARAIARAWVDPAFKTRLLADANAALAEMGLPAPSGAEGEHMRVAENTESVHNLIVCTLCSCYAWPVLGLPPYWYKDPVFRARAVREPRAVLREFGLDLDDSVEVRVWDSSGQIRWFVLPQRPPGTDALTEEQLAALVTPEAMMGAARVAAPGS
jgi:nitrile hydratase subunit alpha